MLVGCECSGEGVKRRGVMIHTASVDAEGAVCL